VKQQGKGDVKFDEFIKDMSFNNLEFLNLQHRQDVKVLSGGDLNGDGKDDDGKDDDGLEKFMQTMVKESLDAGRGKVSHASRVLSQPGFLRK
jgi:hypothetical protein